MKKTHNNNMPFIHLMATSSNRRIAREWVNIMKDAEQDEKEGIVIRPVSDENPRDINIFLKGAKDTPYENGEFHIRMYLPDEYPMVPPKIYFYTPIYHPNINKKGDVCLSILKKQGSGSQGKDESTWSPAIQIKKVVLSLMALLSCPNPDDPLNNEAANLWKTNLSDAHAKAREWVHKYARPVHMPEPKKELKVEPMVEPKVELKMITDGSKQEEDSKHKKPLAKEIIL